MVTARKDAIQGRRRAVSLASYHALLAECVEYLDHPGLEVVRKAYATASRAHDGVTRRSGEPYIEHPLAVARWLAQRRVAADCIAAALLHDVVEDTPISLQRLRSRFGPVIATLVDGVTKFEAVEEPDDLDEVTHARERKNRQQTETVRKLLLAMAEDPRVALIKLADRLHNLRTLQAMRPDRQMAIARETLEIYVPLADRLGVGEAKYELQDTALRYLDPLRCEYLERAIAEEVAKRSAYTEIILHALRQVMMRHGLDAEVSARVKHLSSVYERIVPTDGDVGDITDLVTFRVLVTTQSACYGALQAIHEQWQQLDTRLRDYIGLPKLNGYRALHTTVFGPEGLFDANIRTYEMQEIADLGPVLIAARGANFRNSRMQALAWIEQVRAWQRELPLSATDFVAAVRGDLFQDQIFVVTPKGEVKDLASGATVLDLAYRIHTNLGDHCVGAKITGADNLPRLEGADYQLQSGEIVEIIPKDQVQPNAGWLRIVKTRHAHDAITHYLREHDLPLEENLSLAPPVPSSLLAHARLAFCCEPAPEDELIGVQSGRRFTVHRQGCRFATSPNWQHGETTREDDAHQRVSLRWEMLRPDSYRVTLDIVGGDRSGLVLDISRIMHDIGVNIGGIGAHSNSSRVKATIWLKIDVTDPEQYELAMQRIKGIDGVVKVVRRQHPDDHHLA